MAESVSQREFFSKDKMHYMAAQAATEHDYDHTHDEHLSLQDCMRHTIAFLSEMLGNTMHLHQALRQPDSCQFVDSVVKEFKGHVDCKHWEVTPRVDVPKDTNVLPSVWAIKRKHNLTTSEIPKHRGAATDDHRRAINTAAALTPCSANAAAALTPPPRCPPPPR